MENYNILIVGDKSHFILYSDVFENSGYELFFADALEAVSYLKTHNFKIVVTEFDLNNTEVNGVTVFLYTKNKNRDSIVVVSCTPESVRFLETKYSFDVVINSTEVKDEIRRRIALAVAETTS